MKDYDNIKDSIKIPKELDKAVLEGFNRGKKEKERNKRANFIKKGTMVAGIALSITLTTGFINPSIVKAIPGVQRIVDLFNTDRNGEKIDKYKEFSTSVEMSKKDNGIRVALEDVVIDDNKFLLSLTVEGDKLVGDKIDVEVRPEINNEPVLGTNSSVKKIGENKVAVVTTGNTSQINLGEEVNMIIRIGGVLLWNPDFKEINGDWQMNIKVKKDDALKYSFKNNNEKLMEVEDMKIKTEELIVSKLGATLSLSGNIGEGKNKEEFSKISYIIRDDKGEECSTQILESKINPDTGEFQSSLEILSNLKNSKYLEIIPVISEQHNDIKDQENKVNSKIYEESKVRLDLDSKV